jgi:hypothetical protein
MDGRLDSRSGIVEVVLNVGTVVVGLAPHLLTLFWSHGWDAVTRDETAVVVNIATYV